MGEVMMVVEDAQGEWDFRYYVTGAKLTRRQSRRLFAWQFCRLLRTMGICTYTKSSILPQGM